MSTADEMVRLRAAIDRSEIQQALARYARGVDRCDAKLIASAFHPDAVDHHGAQTLKGTEVGPVLAEKQRQRYKGCFHHIGNCLIEIDGDRAAVETYFTTALLTEENGTEMIIEAHGRYIDRFERRDGEWRIARRTVATDWAHKRPAGERSAFVAPPSLRTPEDLSYANFDLSR